MFDRCVFPLLLLGACSSPDGLPNEGDDTADGGGTFVGTGDDAESIGPDPAGGGEDCSTREQDCPGNQKCLPYSADGDTTWNGVRCSPLATDPRGLGEPCTAPAGPSGGEDDCDLGLMCWNVAPSQTSGVCFALCGPAGACPDPQTVCSTYNDGALSICLPTCDPLGQDCGAGEVCIPQGAGDEFVCAIDASVEGGQYGDPCRAFNKCDPGLFCAPAPSVPGCTDTGCCSDYCDLSAADPDAMCDGASDGQRCTPWSTTPAPGFESLGACAVPQ